MSGGAPEERRTLAPLGRRRGTVSARRSHGPYVVLEVEDPDGPPPRPGQFHMLAAAERWGGGAGERPFLPRAFSVLRAPRPGRLEFLLEVVGPGTARLAELGPGDGVLLLGPLGVGFAPPAAGRSALLVGGGVGIAPLAIWQDARRAAGEPAAAVLGFRDAAHAAGAELLHGPEVATDDGTAGHRGPVTDLLAARLDGAGSRRRLRLRPAGHARGRPGALRRARGPRAARDGVRHGLRVRRVLRLRRPDPRGVRAPLRRGPGPRRGRPRDRARRRNGPLTRRASDAAR